MTRHPSISFSNVRELTAEGIRRLRMGKIIIQTVPGTAVRVRQLRHEFPFGTALRASMWDDKTPADIREKYLRMVCENFNYAVHENALKWPFTEKEPGQSDFSDAERMLEWCEKHGITMRGHCVFWGFEKYIQPWIRLLDDVVLREALRRRAREVATRFKGRIREYDLNNEMIHGDYFVERLGRGITREMFDWFKETDPAAILYVNDNKILAGEDAPLYCRHIRQLLDDGVPVGGIGCQGHFGGQVDLNHVQSTLDDLTRFKLPIKVTEFDVDSPDEAFRAKSLDALYRIFFAHPAVTGILMWGFWEGAHWKKNAPLWKRDFTPHPAARAYRNLVFKEWWTDWEGKADEMGRCVVTAFHGRHEVKTADCCVTVDLKKADGEVVVKAGGK